MIKFRLTENLAGVAVSGDFNDFYDLVEAFHEIAIYEDDTKNSYYSDISTRVLGLCYDIRHAYQGDRSVLLEENGMDRDKMKWHGIITPESNVYYECKCIFPEMVFNMLAIDKLIEVKARNLSKNRYFELTDKKVLWNKSLSMLRLLQSQFVECVEEIHEPRNFSRWYNLVASRINSIEEISGGYIDLVNISYLKLDKDNRLKKLNIYTKRITEFYHDPDYRKLKKELDELKKEHGHSHFRLNMEYPEKIDW
jgi:hypothetical protein